tara:strand:- start:1224 stop:2519 length:1296 start_codon:yes stop_codon:yes gene_type:complete
MANTYQDNKDTNISISKTHYPSTKGKQKVTSKTVYDAEIWGRENVYIFPEKVYEDSIRGVIWIIPPPNITDVPYRDNPGFPGQHFAYDMAMNALENGDIPQEEYIICILPSSETDIKQASDMAVKTGIFNSHGFDYYDFIDLCGCCTDETGREYLNIVYGMGDGCGEIDFDDDTITNVVMIDPILTGDVEIPEEFVQNISMINNPLNHDPTTEVGQATIANQEMLAEKLSPDNVITTNDPKFDFFNLASIGFAALNFLAGLGDLFGGLNKELPWADHAEEPFITSSLSTKPPPEDKSAPNDPPQIQTQSPSEFTRPQVVINSDRILINSKSDDIRLSSNIHIGLSALEAVGIDAGNHFTVNSPEIYLGLGAVEPLILGDQMTTWLSSLLDALRAFTYTNSGGPTGPAINIYLLDQLEASLDQLKSRQNKTL